MHSNFTSIYTLVLINENTSETFHNKITDGFRVKLKKNQKLREPFTRECH